MRKQTETLEDFYLGYLMGLVLFIMMIFFTIFALSAYMAVTQHQPGALAEFRTTVEFWWSFYQNVPDATFKEFSESVYHALHPVFQFELKWSFYLLMFSLAVDCVNSVILCVRTWLVEIIREAGQKESEAD